MEAGPSSKLFRLCSMQQTPASSACDLCSRRCSTDHTHCCRKCRKGRGHTSGCTERQRLLSGDPSNPQYFRKCVACSRDCGVGRRQCCELCPWSHTARCARQYSVGLDTVNSSDFGSCQTCALPCVPGQRRCCVYCPLMHTKNCRRKEAARLARLGTAALDLNSMD